jgi:hypothetical protein
MTGVIDALGNITGVGATFSGLIRANAGISASGITVGGSISLQNQEFIRNTTNGRMDFMPAPAGSTQYGMYMDFTSWSYGVKLGTIRASDNATNQAGFLWEAPLTINADVNFNLGSDGQNGLVNSSVGNRTNQLYTNTASGQNSGAFAIIDASSVGAANRSPGVTHTNPNLYVYRSGSARANDFVRIEHDGTNGRIVSGGTSGINLEPGSGVLNVIGGISASGATFSSNVSIGGNLTVTGTIVGNQGINTQTGTTYSLVLSDSGKLVTLNNASGITMTFPTFASVGITGGAVVYFAQLGVGTVGFTGAAGVSVRTTPGLFLRTQYSTASAIKIATNEWLISGDMTA